MTDAMTLRARARLYLGDAARGIRSAPVEVLATLCVALAFSTAVELGDEAFSSFAETAVACVLLLVAAWTGTLLEAMRALSTARRWLITLAGGAAVAVYAIGFADFSYESEAWRAALLVGAALLWVLALPAFGGLAQGRVDRMRAVDGRILLRLIGAMLYGAALFAGLALALAAVDTLFELELDGEIYAHVWGWIFFVLVPWIVLGGLPDYVRPLGETNAVAGVAQRIVAWLVPPLLAIYFMILYAYVVRIALTSEIPKNMVSPLVLAAGALGGLGLMLFDPKPGERGLSRWLRYAPALLLPLAPLGAWALLIRVEQYGLTEFRIVRLVALFALGAHALLGTVELVRRRRFMLHVVPLSLALVLLLTAVGPWSAIALSRRSQQERLAQGLAEVGIDPNDSSYAAPPDSSLRIVPYASYEKIRGSAQYLARNAGPDALPPVLHRAAHGEDARWLDHPAELGLRPDSLPEQERFAMGSSLRAGLPMQLAGGTGYRISFSAEHPGPGSAPGTNEENHVALSLADSMRLAVRVDGAVFFADLGPMVARIGPQMERPGHRPDEGIVTLTDTGGVARGQLLVWSLWIEQDSTSPRLGNVEGLVVIARE